MNYILIAGSRSIKDRGILEQAIEEFETKIQVDVVIHGKAAGVDTIAGEWASARYGKHVVEVPAMWHKYGKAAGHIRNSIMCHLADAALYIWDGESAGTLDCMKRFNMTGKPMLVVRPQQEFIPVHGVYKKKCKYIWRYAD